MIAVATTSRRSVAALDQWSSPRHRIRLLAGQILAAERRRVRALIESNLHLLDLAAGHFSKRFPSVPREDLAQAAYFGLVKSAESFDATRGAQFHTWAFFQIRAAINSEFFRMGSLIRVPKRPAAPVPKVRSLDAPQGNNGSAFGALIVDEDAATPADLAHRADLRDHVAEALKTLIPRDAEIIALRFGINGAGYPHTLTEVARHFGVCPQRIAEIERRALGNLRDALASFAE